MASPALAFDGEADGYDAGFGRNPSGLVFRYVFQERLLGLFPPAARVLDLGCGTGEDALFLARSGREVVGVDASPRMVLRARETARRQGLAGASFETLAAEQVASLGGPFDGAYSDFGALNCCDLGAVGDGLARVLRRGAPVLLSLMGPWPLPATVQRALRGSGEARRAGRPRVGGVVLEVRYPTPGQARARLGPAFAWRAGFALGVLLPGPDHAAWAARHPQAFGLLAALERPVRSLPLLRALGDHNVLEGERR